MTEEDKIRDAILKTLKERGASKTACPSEVARAIYEEGEWRDRMSIVRSVAVELARQERIEICLKGDVVDPEEYHGPIRLRLKPDIGKKI